MTSDPRYGQQDPQWQPQPAPGGYPGQPPYQAQPGQQGQPFGFTPPQQHPQQWQQPHPQQPYPQQQWQPPVAAPKANVGAIIALVSGILGLLLLPILFGPVGLIAGFVGFQSAPKHDTRARGMAVVGILLGGVCTLIAAVGIASLG